MFGDIDAGETLAHRIEGEADPLLVVTDGAPGLIAGADPRRNGDDYPMTSLSDGLGPQKDPNSGRTRVESGPAGTHRPTGVCARRVGPYSPKQCTWVYLRAGGLRGDAGEGWKTSCSTSPSARSVRTPLRRVAEARDQARVICFLASRDVDFVTGVTIDVTGGI